MAAIGPFAVRAGGAVSGAVRVLAMALKIGPVPPRGRKGRRAPPQDGSGGKVEPGAAGKTTRQDNNNACRSGWTPRFAKAIHAALVVIDGQHSLVRSRPINAPKDERSGPPRRTGGADSRPKSPAPRAPP
ncbi:hypothetical protein ASD89_02205 [Caulobacter sp. Root656]|nr:hypothetical protein ASD89_02205 [Caulobacter sp. Root656]